MQTKLSVMLALLVLTISGPVMAGTLTFSEYPVGTIVTNQYQALGVTFSGALSGPPIIAFDGAMPTDPVLSPDPPYRGTFNINFPGGAFGVQFDSGYWDAVGSAVINVYDPSSALIGAVTNTMTGVDHIDLSGLGTIGRIYFDSTGDGGGADIDNLQFTPIPEPGSLSLFVSGLLGLALWARKFLR